MALDSDRTPGGMLDTLALILRQPDWHADALCIEYPEVSFFPSLGQPTGPAKAVCAACLVRAECLDWALANEVDHGVWGGESPAGRQALRQALRAA